MGIESKVAQRAGKNFRMDSHNDADDGFDLQPNVPRPAPAGVPASGTRPNADVSPVDGSMLEPDIEKDPTIPDGPPDEKPKVEKVDFENLPEFVWQREMLRTVRLIAVFVTLVIVIVLLVAFLGAGKGAKESLKSVIEGEQQPPEAKP